MTEGDARERWNARYASAGSELLAGEAPAEWLVEHRALLAERGGGRALDVACGDGRNALLLAQLGYDVDAVDVSDVAIGRLRAAAAEHRLPVRAETVDLEREPLPAGGDGWDVVVVLNYLQRDLFAALQDALAPGGLLLYETFAAAHLDELGKRTRPAYVLARNELLRAFPALHVTHYREGVAERSGGPRGVASLVAERPDGTR